MSTCFIVDNFPPSIQAEETFRVTIGQEARLVVTVTDPGDEVTFTVQGGLPANSVLEKISDNEYVFRWSPQQVFFSSLTFVANDSSGATSVFTPILEVCACVNGGNCTLDGVLTSNIIIIMACQCSQGKCLIFKTARLHGMHAPKSTPFFIKGR